MRLARNLLLAATAAIAAMAFMATSAFAQSVEVVTEPGGVHCADVVEEAHHDSSSTNCSIGAISTANAQTFTHTGAAEVVTTSCENEFNADISEDGTGYIDTTDTTIHINPGTGCVLTPCEEGESQPAEGRHAELEWPISGILEYGSNREEMALTFCIRAINSPEGGNPGGTCTVLVTVAQNAATHVITFTANQDPCHENANSELSGTWQTTGTNEVELLHEHYPGDYPAS